MKRIEFIQHDVWRRITTTVKRRRSRCHVAIAYFGKHGSELLPLTKGSVLVVDATLAAVESGQTHPGELLKLINRGVAVYSCAGLHAKVVVAGDEVFVGSMNASRRSATQLAETAIRTGDRLAVSHARQFVADHAIIAVGPEQARHLMKLYRPPALPPSTAHKRAGGRGMTPLGTRLWIAKVETTGWDGDDYAAVERGLPFAEKRLRDRKRFESDVFVWDGAGLGNIRERDLIVCVHREPDGRNFISAPGFVLHVTSYGHGQQVRRVIFFEVEKRRRRKLLERVLAKLSPKARAIVRNGLGRQVPLRFVTEVLSASGAARRSSH